MTVASRVLAASLVTLALAAQACGDASRRAGPEGASGSAGTSGATGNSGMGGSASGGAATGVSGGGATGLSGGGAATGVSGGGATGLSGGGAAGGGAAGVSAGGSNSGESGGPSTGGGSGAPGFSLLWKDEFDTFDATRWDAASHTFTENMAQFTPANAVVGGGVLALRLTVAPSGSAKPYLSGEVRTHAEFTYGRFETRARFARGSGLVSSLFTFYDHLPMNWNEIDVEFLGRYADRIQYNTIFWDAAQARRTHEHVDGLNFDPAADFHIYAIEWLPGEVRLFVDGQLRHTETEGIAQYMTLPQKLMMNLWPANVPDWVGSIDATAIPTESQYDWVAVYAFNP